MIFPIYLTFFILGILFNFDSLAIFFCHFKFILFCFSPFQFNLIEDYFYFCILNRCLPPLLWHHWGAGLSPVCQTCPLVSQVTASHRPPLLCSLHPSSSSSSPCFVLRAVHTSADKEQKQRAAAGGGGHLTLSFVLRLGERGALGLLSSLSLCRDWMSLARSHLSSWSCRWETSAWL